MLWLCNSSLLAQGQETSEKILWNPAPLDWKDFRGTSDKDSPFHANTSTGLSYSWSLRTGPGDAEFSYEVASFFIPQESWVLPGKASAYLLAHEQIHFDISELLARKLRSIMEAFDPLSTENPKESLRQLYLSVDQERMNLQQQYDRETNHSQNPEAQAYWQDFVRKELEKTEAYRSNKSQ